MDTKIVDFPSGSLQGGNLLLRRQIEPEKKQVIVKTIIAE